MIAGPLLAMLAFLVALSAVAYVSIRLDIRRERIQRARDAANARTWAHIVKSRDADWAAWQVELEESR